MEKILEFDKGGYLQPSEAMELNLSDFKDTFVVNTRRERLFDAYLNCMALLEDDNISWLYQWINGSFTSKKLYPNDIDIVIFLNERIYDKQISALREIKFKVKPDIDVHFVKVYEENSENLNIYTKSDKLTWHHLFSRDREKSAKGYVQINF